MGIKYHLPPPFDPNNRTPSAIVPSSGNYAVQEDVEDTDLETAGRPNSRLTLGSARGARHKANLPTRPATMSTVTTSEDYGLATDEMKLDRLERERMSRNLKRQEAAMEVEALRIERQERELRDKEQKKLLTRLRKEKEVRNKKDRALLEELESLWAEAEAAEKGDRDIDRQIVEMRERLRRKQDMEGGVDIQRRLQTLEAKRKELELLEKELALTQEEEERTEGELTAMKEELKKKDVQLAATKLELEKERRETEDAQDAVDRELERLQNEKEYR